MDRYFTYINRKREEIPLLASEQKIPAMMGIINFPCVIVSILVLLFCWRRFHYVVVHIPDQHTPPSTLWCQIRTARSLLGPVVQYPRRWFMWTMFFSLCTLSEIKWIYIIRSFQNFTGERKNHWGLILCNLSTFFTLNRWFQVCFFILGIKMPPKKMYTTLKAKKRPRFVKISPFWGKYVLSHTFLSKWIYILCC